MSFFQKAKPRKTIKRKFEPKQKKGKGNHKKFNGETRDEDGDESLDSDEETHDVPDRSESEGETETAQEKKLRLARLYLEEVEREERARADQEDDDGAVSTRLRDDLLQQQGRLRRTVASSCVAPAPVDVHVLKARDFRLPVTCLCVSSDGQYLFSGTKCSTIVKWSLKDMKKVNSIVYKKGNKKGSKFECHSTPVQALAITSDIKYLVSSEEKNDIQVWDGNTLNHIHTFRGHRDWVTDLTFRKDSHQLFSASKDRTVKVWSLDEMAYIETVFGHQSAITSIDALFRERAITAGGRDNTIRIWKVVEESQLIFNGHTGSIDCVRLINEENFISCSDDGSICLWGNMKKKPLCVVNKAHGIENDQVRWVTCVAAFLNTDLVASGSHDGIIRLWKINENFKNISPILEIPVPGFVNSLVFSPDGSKLIAGVGQEHKLARWWKVKEAKNAVYVIPLKYE